jgi:hypothetical protein
VKGIRYPDGEYLDEPGSYSKHTVNGEECWMVKVPTGGVAFYIGRTNKDGSPRHWIQEHEDGTITVQPNPPDAPEDRRNSNSIAFNGWHGYIYRGEWTEG